DDPSESSREANFGQIFCAAGGLDAGILAGAKMVEHNDAKRVIDCHVRRYDPYERHLDSAIWAPAEGRLAGAWRSCRPKCGAEGGTRIQSPIKSASTARELDSTARPLR